MPATVKTEGAKDEVQGIFLWALSFFKRLRTLGPQFEGSSSLCYMLKPCSKGSELGAHTRGS